MSAPFDALLVLSFGGPEKPEDVMPFLENVTRGRNVPRPRLDEVAETYLAFGGKSPINDQCRALIAALQDELAAHGPRIPIYWGNRNWHPFVEDTVREMKTHGIQRALVFVTSAYSSYSACRQYLEDIDRARAAAGEGAPLFSKIRHFCDHPGFLETLSDRLRDALDIVPTENRDSAHLLFTAHSIPIVMAQSSKYVEQLQAVAGHLAAVAGSNPWRLVWQSRSGPPHQPWLEPDVKDALTGIAASDAPRDVVVMPIGFISDHMEVMFDLDIQAADRAHSLGLNMVRAGTAGTHPRFITMIRELIEERMRGDAVAEPCAAHCCPNPHTLVSA